MHTPPNKQTITFLYENLMSRGVKILLTLPSKLEYFFKKKISSNYK